MHFKPFRMIETVRSSYWFVPSVMAFGALLLGIAAVWLDHGPGTDWLDQMNWYQKSKPDAAREMLSAIASSMITVAGVVFSITIVAIAFAAAQYGPRVLTNFMSDRGNQTTLGTFIGTFVYSLVVLRTIHSGNSEFVPQFAVLLGIFLALCSIAVLIYFIHHVPRSIHVNSVVARIGRDLLHHIDKRGRRWSAEEDDNRSRGRPEPRPVSGSDDDAAEVRTHHTGYVQSVDEGELVECASKHELLINLSCGPGEFTYLGRTLLTVKPAGHLTDDLCGKLRSAFVIGDSRTPLDDPTFLVDELVEIAARALSSGVNDPYTAMTCLDWMGAAAARLAEQPTYPEARRDSDGMVRLFAPRPGFETLVERGFARVRPYVARDINAATHTLSILASLADSCREANELVMLKTQAELLVETARQHLEKPQLASLEEAKAEADNCFQKAGKTEAGASLPISERGRRPWPGRH